MKKIEAVWITLNRSCNLRCSFCYTNTLGFKAKDVLTLNNIQEIINFCREGDIKHVTLIGGEPTVYKYLPETIKMLTDNDLTFTIVTNGIRLNNEEYLNKLLENGFSKCSMVSISLKETNEDLYEKVTGSRAYEQTYNALKKMKELDIPSSVSFVITFENVSRYLDGIKKFIDINGNYFIGLSICYDFNQTNEKDPNFLSKNNYFKLIKDFIKTIPELERITNGQWTLQNGIPRCLMDDTDFEIIKSHSTVGCQLIDGWGLVFDTDLSIIPCNSSYDTKLGKLGEDYKNYKEFEELFTNGKSGQAMKYLRSLPHPICRACSNVSLCKGACLSYWSQFDFEQALEFKYEHNFMPNCINLTKLINDDKIIGVHGTSLSSANNILTNGLISSRPNKYLNFNYNFAFYLKPSYKDNKYPLGLNYIISSYNKSEITNIFPFDSGYYINKYKDLSITNYWISFNKLNDFIYKKFGTLNNYYSSNFNFIPINNIDRRLHEIYASASEQGNPDMRVRSIELSCINDHLINKNNLKAIVCPISNILSFKNKSEIIIYSLGNHFALNLEYSVKSYYLRKGYLK